MDIERESKEIVTPVDQHKVVIKTYLTGGESRVIENVYIDESGFTVADAQTAKISSAIIDKAQDKLIEVSILSINGIADDIVQRVLGMKKQDTQFVLNAIRLMSEGSEFDKKKD